MRDEGVGMAALVGRGLATTYGHIEPPAETDVILLSQPVLSQPGQDGTTGPDLRTGRLKAT
jgi:hypothetical protein